MFVHLSVPSLDASCFSMAETAALGDEPQVCGASAGCSGQSQPAQPSQDSCWGLMERWITSQAAAAAPMNLQNSSDLAECPGPYAHPAIESKLCAQGRMGVSGGMSEEISRMSRENLSIFKHFYTHQNHSGYGLFYQKRLLSLQESSLAHRHRGHHWEPEEPLLGPPHCPLLWLFALNQHEAATASSFEQEKGEQEVKQFPNCLGSALKAQFLQLKLLKGCMYSGKQLELNK